MPDAPDDWLDPDAAARKLCVRVDALGRLVRQGRIPAPTYRLGPRSPRWSSRSLDVAMDTGTASTNHRIAVKALVDEIKAEGRARRPA